MMAWLVPVAVAGVAVVAVISYIRSEETHAASGSPLYGRAVQEAVEGLKNPAAKTAAARPPLAAGLSPDEYYWCEQCKAYHKRQPGQSQPAGAPPQPVAGVGAVIPVTPAAAVTQPPGTIPPLPAGLSAQDYYWCADCKAYHPRNPAQGQPAGTTPPPVAADNPASSAAAAQPADVIPPLPAGLAPADYYWCTNCKAYHKRQPTPAVPASGTAPTPAPVVPPGSPVVPAAPGHVPAAPAPATPVAPVTPVNPAAPVIPATPAVPVNPATPTTPTTPATPAPPATPVIPVNPVAPSAPVIPPAPVPPVTPVAPEKAPAAPPATETSPPSASPPAPPASGTNGQ